LNQHHGSLNQHIKTPLTEPTSKYAMLVQIGLLLVQPPENKSYKTNAFKIEPTELTEPTCFHFIYERKEVFQASSFN
jgi:hypothetical protein